jgi:hypothetical protein
MSLLAPAPARRTIASPHDFDFLFGRWDVANERLQQRLAHCQQWEHFPAQAECRPLPGRLGNLETWTSDWQGGVHGMALRLFEPEAEQWSIRWASDRDGRLEPAVRGGFEGAVGVFFGPDFHQGREVLARYRWTVRSADRATWDQAWSSDAGLSWETNWVMHFTRRGD